MSLTSSLFRLTHCIPYIYHIQNIYTGIQSTISPVNTRWASFWKLDIRPNSIPVLYIGQKERRHSDQPCSSSSLVTHHHPLWNKSHSDLRNIAQCQPVIVDIKSGYGKKKNKSQDLPRWRTISDQESMNLYEQPVGVHYRVGVVITKVHTCVYKVLLTNCLTWVCGNQTSQYLVLRRFGSMKNRTLWQHFSQNGNKRPILHIVMPQCWCCHPEAHISHWWSWHTQTCPAMDTMRHLMDGCVNQIKYVVAIWHIDRDVYHDFIQKNILSRVTY